MATIENETRTRPGTCPAHGQVRGAKEIPKIKFPFMVTAPLRGIGLLRPYRCPACGAKVS